MALDLNDKTGNGHTLTNSGVAEYTSDFPYAAITKAGSWVASEEDQMYTADAADLRFTSDFTLQCWLNPTDLPASDNFFAILSRVDGTTGASQYGFNFRNPSGTRKLALIISNGATFETNQINHTPTTGAWHHYAVVWTSSTTTVEFFLDGVSLGTATGSVNPQAGTNEFTIGSQTHSNPTNQPGTYYNGKIADIRLYNVARTGAHIAADYNKLLTTASTDWANLKAWWPYQTVNTNPATATGGAFLQNFV
jgi:hypothetical protein